MHMPSDTLREPSCRKYSERATASMYVPTSRTNTNGSRRKECSTMMEPHTIATVNTAAPIISPNAIDPASFRIARNVDTTSGDAFPSARSVTPTTLSLSSHRVAMDDRLGQKKSLATSPSTLNRASSHTVSSSVTPICTAVDASTDVLHASEQ